MSPLYPNYYDVFNGEFQLKVVYGVNKYFYRSWDVGTLEYNSPGYPTQCYISLWERPNADVTSEPIIKIGSYVAGCAQPGNFLGTSDWLWMAIGYYQPFGQTPLPYRQIHIQYKNTNVGSIGMVMYPLLPE